MGLQRLQHLLCFRIWTLFSHNMGENVNLGNLEVGSSGQQMFGDFQLSWRVFTDHVAWEILDTMAGMPRNITGALKYVGWNRFHTNGRDFEVYVHQWPDFKNAIDYLYYNIGKAIAAGTYESSFEDPNANLC